MVDHTKNCIRDSMIALLQKKPYNEILMKEIAEEAHVSRRTLYRYFENKEQILEYVAESQMAYFTQEIIKREQLTLYNVIHAFFSFFEKHHSEFLILKKARLLHYIEDHLYDLATQVAAKTKYRDMTPQELAEHLRSTSPEDHYALYYTIAGVWRIAMVWMDEQFCLSPDEMAEIAVAIVAHNHK